MGPAVTDEAEDTCLEAALQAALAAVRTTPRKASAHIRAGNTHADVGHLEHAIKNLRRASELDPSSTAAATALSVVEARLAAKCLRYTLAGHSGTVHCLAFHSAQGEGGASWLASASADHVIRLWDPNTGDCRHLIDSHTDQVTVLAFSPAGVLASGSLDCAAHLHTVVDGKLSCTVLTGHNGRVTSLAFLLTGDRLLTGSTDREVRLWAVEGGECLLTLRGHRGIVPAVSCSGDGRLISSASGDGSCRVWQAEDGEGRHEIAWECGGVNTCSFTPAVPGGHGNGFLATCHIDIPRQEGRVLMWDVDGTEGWVDGSIRGYCRNFEGFRGRVTCIDFAQTEDCEALLMATACEDGTVRVFDVGSSASLYDVLDDGAAPDPWAAFSRAPAQAGTLARFSRCARLLAVVFGGSACVQVHDGETGDHVMTLRVGGGRDASRVTAVCWNDEGGLLATAHADGVCLLWDLSSISDVRE